MSFKYEIGEILYNGDGETVKVIDREVSLSTIDHKQIIHQGAVMYATVRDYGHYQDNGEVTSYYEEELTELPKKEIRTTQSDAFLMVAETMICMLVWIMVFGAVILTAKALGTFLIQLINYA